MVSRSLTSRAVLCVAASAVMNRRSAEQAANEPPEQLFRQLNVSATWSPPLMAAEIRYRLGLCVRGVRGLTGHRTAVGGPVQAALRHSQLRHPTE